MWIKCCYLKKSRQKKWNTRLPLIFLFTFQYNIEKRLRFFQNGWKYFFWLVKYTRKNERYQVAYGRISEDRQIYTVKF